MSIPQSSGTGFIVNGQRLTPQQAYARSQMLDGLLAYYYHRYSKDHCCGDVGGSGSGESGYGKHQQRAVTLQYAPLQQLYTDDLGKLPPSDS